MANPLSTNLADAVRRMNGTRRFVGLAVLGGALALLWVASRWAAGPTYVPLFQNLELSTVSTITDNLTKAGIPFRLEQGGAELLVPTAEIARARVLLAKDGLPSTGRPGLELFDKPTWGMTDFTQRITYRRALEGELARTIGALDGVERAQIHLALPEQSALRKLERPAEAAVVLTLRPGVRLTPDVVQGIASIVSNSVEQLASENVAVMDNSGRLLSMPSDQAGVYGLSSRQLDLQRSVERQLADKAESLLATVVGAGKARAQVAAQLNFEQVDRTVESYDPDGQVLQTEQRSETAGEPETTAGAQTIISNAYQNSKRVERTIGSIGGVERLTVAVMVDDRALGSEARSTAQSPEQTVRNLEALVASAIGLDSTRGDRLTLSAVPFEVNTALLAELPSDSVPPRDVLVVVERFSRPGILLLGVVLAFVLAWRLLRAQPAPAGVAGTLPGTAAPALAGSAAAAMSAAPAVPAVLSAAAQLRNQVKLESAGRPEVAAQVIRAWMVEG